MAAAGVWAGLVLDGGSVKQIVQPTAALIVLGGTIGAVMIQFPMKALLETLRQLRLAFLEPVIDQTGAIDELVSFCSQVRKFGLLRLDGQLDYISDGFLRKALTLAVDGLSVSQVREIMEGDLDRSAERDDSAPKVLEVAGGFAPTLGIVGAVLGLIQVMQRLDNLPEIGKGIAVAFVSTLYGIGFANLFFLPLAGKLRIRVREREVAREMKLEAVVAMMEGISARALRERLEVYVLPEPTKIVPLIEPEMAVPVRVTQRRTTRGMHVPPAHDRWLLSYADFVTLLLAVFIMLFAVSWHNRHSIQSLSRAVTSGFSTLSVDPPMQEAATNLSANSTLGLSPPISHQELPALNTDELSQQLQVALAGPIDRHEVVMHKTADGIVISLRELGFFSSGGATLVAGAGDKLRRIAQVLMQHDLAVRVEGHSDDQPIHTSAFDSNWELSTARAMSVLSLLRDQTGFPPKKLSVAGYGPYHPVANNETAEGRRTNRRVDLVVLSSSKNE